MPDQGVSGKGERILLYSKNKAEQFVQEVKEKRQEMGRLHKKETALALLFDLSKSTGAFLGHTTDLINSTSGSDLVETAREFDLSHRVANSDEIPAGDQAIEAFNQVFTTKGNSSLYHERRTTDKSPGGVLKYRQAIEQQFKVSLDSTLPQLENLLENFFPSETGESAEAQKAKLLKRELLFLRGMARFVRLYQKAIGLQKSEKFGGLFIPEGRGVRSQLGGREQKKFTVDLLLTYIVQNSPLCSEIRADLPTDKLITLGDLEELQLKYDLQTLKLYPSLEMRMAKFRIWLVGEARKSNKIAGTPRDNQEIQSIIDARQAGNRIAGIILHGPPGTGKTEKLIEANRREGFETHVVSLHRHSDFAQLMGEAPIFLEGLKSESSKLERVQAFRDFLNQENLVEVLKRSPQIIEKLLILTPTVREKLSTDIFTDNLVDDFIAELRSAVDDSLVNIFLDNKQESNESESAWVNGEIQRALAEGKRVLLDEADKAPSSVFDGISALLAKSPGENVSLGGQELHFPHWFHIDMTVNSTALPEHVRDRFSSLELNYPDTEDLLWKLGVWLSDESGQILVDKETEWQTVLFFTYVVPRIHALYESACDNYELQLKANPNAQNEMRPFSMRKMAVFCRRIVNGEPLSRVIDDELLADSKVADVGTESYQKLSQLVATFSKIFAGINITQQSETSSKGLTEVLDSPLYRSVAARTQATDIAKQYVMRPVVIDEALKSDLVNIVAKDVVAAEKNILRLPSGVLITTKQEADGRTGIEYQYPNGAKTEVFFEKDISGEAIVELMSADQFGEVILLSINGQRTILRPFMEKISGGMIPGDDLNGAEQLSLDGRVLIGKVKSEEAGESNFWLKIFDKNNFSNDRKMSLTVNGKPYPVLDTRVAEDGSLVLVRGYDKNVYAFYPFQEVGRIDQTKINVDLNQHHLLASDQDSIWEITGNIIWSPTSQQALVVS